MWNIQWLERLPGGAGCALVVVSHDSTLSRSGLQPDRGTERASPHHLGNYSQHWSRNS